ncbi:20966_t:CDS:2, partial [Rhizophagus irregularis]
QRYVFNASSQFSTKERYTEVDGDDNMSTTSNNGFIQMDIYNDEKINEKLSKKNSEVTSEENSETTSDDEDEVTSEDLETASDDEDETTSEEDPDENEVTNEEDFDDEINVDKSFSTEQMPRNFGDFAPYFSNITEVLFFCWMQKHNILTYHSGDFVIYKESNERRFGRVLAIIQQDNRLKIKIQRILRYEELPKNLQSNSRKERSREGEVWFFDREMDNAIAIVELQAIVKLVLISILYDNHFKQSEIEKFQMRMDVSRSNLAIKLWVKCWILVSKTMAMVFKSSFTEEDYAELRKCLDNERKLLSQRMMSDWFIIKGEVNIEDDADEVYLKKRIVRRHVDASLLLNFQAELALAYEDLEDYSMNQNSSPVFFEYARFYIKENDDIVQCRLHVGDIVTINTEEFGGSFAVIRAIFYHQKNNFRFTFIIIDWFEDMNRTKLGCPVYRLQTANNWRRIFSISLVNAVNTVHFVHDCKDGECAGGNHDFRNNLYMRNLYLFNAV